MLKYLVILLSDDCASFCRYENAGKTNRLIPIDVLKKGIIFGMKENLMIQFALPDYQLPSDYSDAINSIDHTIIGTSCCLEVADIVILNGWDFDTSTLDAQKYYVLRTRFEDFVANYTMIPQMLVGIKRLNLIITDIQTLVLSTAESQYKRIIDFLVTEIACLFKSGISPELNILTDRLQLSRMNNCGAGEEVLTLAPDGKFYICPAFYYGNSSPVGDAQKGVAIPNKQLYKLDHAPICRRCDAYHCQRCIWLNKTMTLECNTPSHEQCVLTHIERDGSARLRKILSEEGFKNLAPLDECNYLDPFDLIVQ